MVSRPLTSTANHYVGEDACLHDRCFHRDRWQSGTAYILYHTHAGTPDEQLSPLLTLQEVNLPCRQQKT